MHASLALDDIVAHFNLSLSVFFVLVELGLQCVLFFLHVEIKLVFFLPDEPLVELDYAL